MYETKNCTYGLNQVGWLPIITNHFNEMKICNYDSNWAGWLPVIFYVNEKLYKKVHDEKGDAT